MNKTLLGAAAAVAGFALALGALPHGSKAAEGVAIPHQEWSFHGIFGQFDRAELQRGLQVYTENCSSCHSLKRIAFRNLAALGYNEAEVKGFASQFLVVDGPDEDGEMFERDGRGSDYFPPPFANDKAAAASNGGAVPPDLSLITKARAGGADYVYALMTGYDDPPADFEVLEGLNYNKYFSGHQIAMAAPLFEEGVEYADGTPATVEQMARDVAAFLTWTAEPEMEARKRMGIKVVLFLIVLTAMLYAVKRKIWSDLH